MQLTIILIRVILEAEFASVKGLEKLRTLDYHSSNQSWIALTVMQLLVLIAVFTIGVGNVKEVMDVSSFSVSIVYQDGCIVCLVW